MLLLLRLSATLSNILCVLFALQRRPETHSARQEFTFSRSLYHHIHMDSGFGPSCIL